MNIVINTIPLLSPLTGVGNCIYHTARELLDTDTKNDYTFYYGCFSDRLVCPTLPADEAPGPGISFLHRARRFLEGHPPVRAVVRRSAETWHRAAARSRRFDLYYEPNYVPLGIRTRSLVVTVHDLSFIHHPEWHPKDRVEYFRKHFLTRIGRADMIATDSEFTRRELLKLVKTDSSRIRTVPLGYDRRVFRPRDREDVERFRRAHELPEKFLLSVGPIEPRKNIDRLLHAYARLPRHLRAECKLVLTGSAGWRSEATMRRTSAMAGEVGFLGYLSTDDLALAYNAATAFVFPSLYEGFGLPVLEAFGCGCPVVASHIEALRETCADAACFVDPTDAAAIAEGIHNILTDNELRRSLARKGRKRAAGFGWDKTARRLLQIFEEVSSK